jgi:hypothetical protein
MYCISLRTTRRAKSLFAVAAVIAVACLAGSAQASGPTKTSFFTAVVKQLELQNAAPPHAALAVHVLEAPPAPTSSSTDPDVRRTTDGKCYGNMIRDDVFCTTKLTPVINASQLSSSAPEQTPRWTGIVCNAMHIFTPAGCQPPSAGPGR